MSEYSKYGIYINGPYAQSGSVCIYGLDENGEPLRLPVAKYSTALNKAGSAEFTLTPDNPGYNQVVPMVSDVEIGEIDDVVWVGRVTEVKKDFQNRKVCYAEGALAYLNDSIQPYRKWYQKPLGEIVGDILSEHNRQVMANRQIQKGDITVVSAESKYDFETNGESTMSVIQDLLSTHEGYIYLWLSANQPGKKYLYWLKEYDEISTQPVAYGENILDLSQNVNLTDACTCIYPMGENVEVIMPQWKTDDDGNVVIGDDGNPVRAKTLDEDGNETDEDATEIDEMPLTLDMVEVEVDKTEDGGDNGGGEVVIPASVSVPRVSLLSSGAENSEEEDEIKPIRYQIPENAPADISEDPRFIDSPFVTAYGRIVRKIKFNGATDLTTLRAKAQEWLGRQALDGLSIDVNAIDLRLLDTTLGDIRIGKKVQVTSVPHGVGSTLTVIQVDTDITKLSKKLTVGRPRDKSLSDIAGRSSGTTEIGLRLRKKTKSQVTKKDVKDGSIIFIPE